MDVRVRTIVNPMKLDEIRVEYLITNYYDGFPEAFNLAIWKALTSVELKDGQHVIQEIRYDNDFSLTWYNMSMGEVKAVVDSIHDIVMPEWRTHGQLPGTV